MRSNAIIINGDSRQGKSILDLLNRIYHAQRIIYRKLNDAEAINQSILDDLSFLPQFSLVENEFRNGRKPELLSAMLWFSQPVYATPDAEDIAHHCACWRGEKGGCHDAR